MCHPIFSRSHHLGAIFSLGLALVALAEPAHGQVADVLTKAELPESVTARKAFKRAEWVIGQRAFPLKQIPEQALENGYADVLRAEVAQSLRPAPSAMTRHALTNRTD